ncbi:hypothetical protein ACE2AJ_14075 [Aquihabitans daechungensis]|uniref:hypothetical protein n=1 Tax=Aquihabitans daechungensis TaxID=1052257 RepID=UPI003BA2E175
MAPPDNPLSEGSPTDEELLASHAAVLADGIERALGPWVVRCVLERAEAWRPGLGRDLAEPAEAAGRRAAAAVGPEIRALLALDVDAQATGPLAVLRTAVRFPTVVLADAGVPHIVRDEFAERAFPDDVYGLAPASFADLHPALRDPGLVWGAAKAHVVLARRRAEGRR